MKDISCCISFTITQSRDQMERLREENERLRAELGAARLRSSSNAGTSATDDLFSPKRPTPQPSSMQDLAGMKFFWMLTPSLVTFTCHIAIAQHARYIGRALPAITCGFVCHLTAVPVPGSSPRGQAWP